MDPRTIIFWINFEAISVSMLGTKTAPKEYQKLDHLRDPSAPPLSGPQNTKPGTKREVKKLLELELYSLILSKRKGLIDSLKESYRASYFYSLIEPATDW